MFDETTTKLELDRPAAEETSNVIRVNFKGRKPKTSKASSAALPRPPIAKSELIPDLQDFLAFPAWSIYIGILLSTGLLALFLL